MNTDLLIELIHTLDAPTAKHSELLSYYEGRQPLSFMSPESAKRTRLARIASNIPRLVVTSLAERLRIIGFDGADVWPDWIANDLDQLSSVAIREALLFGQSFLICWGHSDGTPLVTVESPRQVAVICDPGTRAVTSAIKRWRTATTTELVIYLPDSIVKMRAGTPGAKTTGFYVVETVTNPLGVVPVVPVRNSDLLDDGRSEIEDCKTLVDALNKTLADMLTTSETAARPMRVISGLELVDRPVLDEDGNAVLDKDNNPILQTVSPIDEDQRLVVSENPDTTYGQLPAADLSGYQNAVNVLIQQIMAVTGLSAAHMGITTENPSSADAIRASEASLTARAEARQLVMGRSFEQVARLIVAIRSGIDPATVNVRVRWADASTRSVAAEADSIVKLVQAGILPVSYALARMGYSSDEIAAIRAARALDATPTPNSAHHAPHSEE